MDALFIQIISGAVVAILSFLFGYFLFQAQTNEQIRLEVYKRRLDSYEHIAKFLDDLDFFSHRMDESFSKREKDEFVKRAFQLDASTRIFTSSEVNRLISLIPNQIDFLPDSLADLEKTHESIFHLLEKDVGEHLRNWRVDFIKQTTEGKKFDQYFSDSEF